MCACDDRFPASTISSEGGRDAPMALGADWAFYISANDGGREYVTHLAAPSHIQTVIPRELPRATPVIVEALEACAAHISAPVIELCAVDKVTITKDMHMIPQIR